MNGCFHGVKSRKFSVNNWNLFWERPRLFRADGLHPSRVGAELLSDNITRTLRSIWLVSQFSNNSYDDFCSTHLNDKGTCSVQSIQTVSVPRIVSSKYKFYAGSRTNLIVIKPEKCKINEQTIFKAWAPKHPITHTESSYCFILHILFLHILLVLHILFSTFLYSITHFTLYFFFLPIYIYALVWC